MPEQAQNAERDSDQARLQAAEQAFAAGNYQALQRELQTLAAVQSEIVVTRVQALRRAIGVDPVHLALLLACLLALFVIAGRESTHESGNEHGAASPRGSGLGNRTERAADQDEST